MVEATTTDETSTDETSTDDNTTEQTYAQEGESCDDSSVLCAEGLACTSVTNTGADGETYTCTAVVTQGSWMTADIREYKL